MPKCECLSLPINSGLSHKWSWFGGAKDQRLVGFRSVGHFGSLMRMWQSQVVSLLLFFLVDVSRIESVAERCARPSGCLNGGRPLYTFKNGSYQVEMTKIYRNCVCPDHFFGPCCQYLKSCVYGELSQDKMSCDCEDERFLGLRCEQVRCLNGGKPFEANMATEYKVQPCRCSDSFTGRFCDVSLFPQNLARQSWLDFDRLIFITALPVLFLVFAFFWLLLRQRKLDFLHKSPWSTGFIPTTHNVVSGTQPSTVMVAYTFCPVHCANESLQQVWSYRESDALNKNFQLN